MQHATEGLEIHAKFLVANPYGKKTVGRPRCRWVNKVNLAIFAPLECYAIYIGG
jgi:hypothetical protein